MKITATELPISTGNWSERESYNGVLPYLILTNGRLRERPIKMVQCRHQDGKRDSCETGTQQRRAGFTACVCEEYVQPKLLSGITLSYLKNL